MYFARGNESPLMIRKETNTTGNMSAKKMNLTSASHSDFMLEALRQIAPSAFTEVRDEHGELTHKVDFEALKELLGDNISNSNAERFGFYWIGKQDAKRAFVEPPRQTLRPDVKDSVDWDNTQNLYIEGDNLEVLKLLRNSYMGKVKMIYIDPPYNTGKDFIYRDNFTMNQDEYGRFTSDVSAEGNRLHANEKTHARYHSDWCSMLYSRLMVAHSLLSQDGVIFISIDDNEVHHLRMICDEVFGASNFVGTFNWVKTETPENLSKKCRQMVEYVLCYQKQMLSQTRFNGVSKSSKSSNGLLNQSNAVGVLTFPGGKVLTSMQDQVLKAGSYGTGKYVIELLQDVEVKDGVFVSDFSLKAKFKWSQLYLDQSLKEGVIIRIPRKTLSPSYEKPEYAPEVPTNLINAKVGVETNENAGEYQLKLFDKKVFSFPKPCSLIQYLLNFIKPEEEFIVLDFFSGSGTTAEAVMNMNKEHIGGKAKFILVQIAEDFEQTPKREISKAQKEIIDNAVALLKSLNKPFNICELAKERIRRAGDEIRKEHPEVDTGFRVLRVDTSNMKEVYFDPATLEKDQLFADSVKKGRRDLDLLFGCMLDLGIELSAPLRQKEVTGKRLHIVNEGALVACFDVGIDLEVICAIAELNPLRVLFRESCFATDADKLNVYEQFKQRCGWSTEESSRRIRII